MKKKFVLLIIGILILHIYIEMKNYPKDIIQDNSNRNENKQIVSTYNISNNILLELNRVYISEKEISIDYTIIKKGMSQYKDVFLTNLSITNENNIQIYIHTELETIHSKSIMNKIRIDSIEENKDYIKKRIILTSDKYSLPSMKILYISFSVISGNLINDEIETIRKDYVIEYKL